MLSNTRRMPSITSRILWNTSRMPSNTGRMLWITSCFLWNTNRLLSNTGRMFSYTNYFLSNTSYTLFLGSSILFVGTDTEYLSYKFCIISYLKRMTSFVSLFIVSYYLQFY